MSPAILPTDPLVPATPHTLATLVILAPQGVLDARGCQIVARMGFMIYTPALTFTKLTQAVSPASIRNLWPLLANMTLRWVLQRLVCGCSSSTTMQLHLWLVFGHDHVCISVWAWCMSSCHCGAARMPVPPALPAANCSIIIGLGLGLLMARLLRTPPLFRTHVLVAIAFGESGCGAWAGTVQSMPGVWWWCTNTDRLCLHKTHMVYL